jgi:hypothetical protein
LEVVLYHRDAVGEALGEVGTDLTDYCVRYYFT